MTETEWTPFDFRLPPPLDFTLDMGALGEVRPAPRNPSSLVDDSPGVVLRARPSVDVS